MRRARGTDTKLIATLYALTDPKPTEAEFTEQHGPDDFEYHQDKHADALDDWHKRQEDMLETVRKFPAAFSARDYYLDILEGRAAAAREADRRLTQTLALGREVLGISDRALAAAAQITNKTVARRITNDPTSRDMIRAYEDESTPAPSEVNYESDE